MKIKTVKQIQMHVTTEEMFRQYMTVMTDIHWDNRNDEMTAGYYNDFVENARCLIEGNFYKIHKGFINGMTAFWVPMGEIENHPNMDICVSHNGKEIGMIHNNEISY